VRRFASNDELQQTNPKRRAVSSRVACAILNLFWPRRECHRFVWDLRYDALAERRSASPSGDRLDFWPCPGNYNRETHGQRQEQHATADDQAGSRAWKTPQDALVRQFGLASRLAERLGEVSMALQQAGDLRKQIDTRKKEAGGKPPSFSPLLQGAGKRKSRRAG